MDEKTVQDLIRNQQEQISINELVAGQNQEDGDTSWVESAIDKGKDWYDVINSIFTGKGKNPENLPEISERAIWEAQGGDKDSFFYGMPGQEGGVVSPQFQAGRMMSDDDAQMRDILKDVLGDAVTFTTDSAGNSVVQIDGNEKYLVNKPGLSRADLDRLAGQLVSFSPISRLYKYGSLLTKTLKAGLGGTAVSLGRDATGVALGAKDWNVNRDVVTGALFALGVPVGLGVSWGSKQMWARLAPWLQGGKISQSGRDQLIKAGYSDDMIDALEPSLSREFVKLEKLYGSEVAATKIVDKVLPEDLVIHKTRGDITQNLRDQQEETLLAGGARGDAASVVAETYVQKQSQNINSVDDALMSNVTGSKNIPPRGEGVALAQSRALELRTLDKQAYEQAYSNAKKLDNFLSPDDQQYLLDKVSNLDLFDETSPPVQKALKELTDMLTGPIEAGSPGVQISRYYDWRRRVTAAARTFSDHQVVLKEIKKRFDGAMNDIIERGYVLGDPQGIKWWQEAVKLRAKFGKEWQASWVGDGRKLISDLTNNISGQLKVSSDEAANYILNASNLGFINKGGLAKGLRELKTQLIAANGLASPGWRGIQEDVLLRLIQNARGAPSGQFMNGQFSIPKFAKGWNQLKGNPELMNVLFDVTQQKMVNNFIYNAVKAGSKHPMGQNPSNSAIMLLLAKPLQKLNLTAPFRARSTFKGEIPVVSDKAPLVAPVMATQPNVSVDQEFPGLGPALLNAYQAPVRAAGGLFDFVTGDEGGF
jgi:hypothetical protein